MIVLIVVVVAFMVVMVVMIVGSVLVAMIIVVVVVIPIILGDCHRVCHMLCVNLHFSRVLLLVSEHDRFIGALRHVLAQVCDQNRSVV